jgi:hypothetical protein
LRFHSKVVVRGAAYFLVWKDSNLLAVRRQRCHVAWGPRAGCHSLAWRERTIIATILPARRRKPMNHIIRPTFLVGVLLWTAFFFIGPSPLENIPQARAQPLLCLSTHQGSPIRYTGLPGAGCIGSAPASATDSPSQILRGEGPKFAQNCPLCCQHPTNPQCGNEHPNCSGCR